MTDLGPLRIVFVHPDLGLGGAERWVVDAALALQERGHRVVIYTASHDPARAFIETVDGRLEVQRRGRFIPADVAQRLRVPCAVLRMIWLAVAVAGARPRFDVVVCDLVPHVVPLLRRLARVPILFYGHYPDLLLTPPRKGWYGLYRAPLDRWEASALLAADRIAVNSRFTAETYRRVLPRLGPHRLEVVPPGVDTDGLAEIAARRDPRSALVLTLGRFAPDKNLELAVDTLAALRQMLAAGVFARTRLVVAGGHDPRQAESRRTLEGLRSRVRRLGLDEKVELRPSIPEEERLGFLERCCCVLHPHPEEHFGIVPVEAMAAARPVVAVDAGGPLETVVDGVTGFLRPARPEAFAAAVSRLLADPELAQRMGRAGRERVVQRFSRRELGRRLEELLRELVGSSGGERGG